MSVNLTLLNDFDTTTKSNEGVWMTLNKPNGAPSKLRLKLLGRDSDRAKKIAFKDLNLRIAAAAAASGKTLQTPKAEELDFKQRWERAFLVVDWEGFTDANGAPEPCSAAEVYKVLEQYPEIDRQVEAFVSEPKNFGKEGDAPAQSIFQPEVYMAEIAGN